MLLHHLPGSNERIEELSAEQEESGLEASSADRFLLDLSATADEAYLAGQRAVAGYRASVDERGARLVVVLPEADHLLDPDLAPLVVRLGRPRGELVFRRSLRAEGVAVDSESLTTPGLTAVLDTAPMRDLARLAELARRARDSGQYGAEASAWCSEAVRALTDWSAEAARQVIGHRTAEKRTLLLAAAMFSGASADAVFFGARSLLDVLGHKEDETPRIARADFGEQLDALDIRRDGDRRVEFSRIVYDSAVRTHFWINFPDLRDSLRDWIGRCVASAELNDEERMVLIDRFSEQCLAIGRPRDLFTLVELCTRPGLKGRYRAVAAAALEAGLGHERYGSAFRAQMYDWATGPRLSADLTRVLVGVCQQVLAATHPEQALIRLQHLAFRRGGEEVNAARSALIELVQDDGRLYSRLVDRLLSASRGRQQDHASLLLDASDPLCLRTVPAWAQLALTWSRVMADLPPSRWGPMVHHCLSAVQQDEEWEPLMDVLLVATAGRTGLLSRLYVVTYDWAAGTFVSVRPGQHVYREERTETAARFWKKIDYMQGAAPARSMSSGSDRTADREGTE
ncbi:hypothetical protein ACEZDB_10215 [Streptacidiphilus sp. N1-3]|uniref:Uncharacterized protein n=1 Tax=Streptacidiphilus alkalitolerans TaxID=3342712 RepID=A0ABV6WYA5_9ACTN